MSGLLISCEGELFRLIWISQQLLVQVQPSKPKRTLALRTVYEALQLLSGGTTENHLKDARWENYVVLPLQMLNLDLSKYLFMSIFPVLKWLSLQ